MTERLILSDHEGEPIALKASARSVFTQVVRQRLVRNFYYKHTNYLLYAPLLYIEVEYKQTSMLLDSMHICIRSFEPQNDAERDAVAEAETLLNRSKIFERDPDLKRHAVFEAAQANELMWLAVTGYFVNVPDKPKVTMNRVLHGTATWNTFEPVDPRLI